jgi:hypothetical protein
MQSRGDVSGDEADSEPTRGAQRPTDRLPPAGSDWSIDADPVNPGWRSGRAQSARQRVAARRTPNFSAGGAAFAPLLRGANWRWLALAAGLLLFAAVALTLWGLGSTPSVADEPADLPGSVAATLPAQATVTAAAAPPTAPPAPQFLSVANTAGQGLFLRPEPNTAGEPLKLLAEGTQLEALGEEVQGADYVWLKVRDPEGAEGWVARDFVVVPEP